ncbi:MAG: GNAT family N-acetyltransferase [Firmicutes bacterium]|nr:GNAT family N-acetyltransferase [Bacillota bacterium]
MSVIRLAEKRDLARIAEIQIFNFRLYFYPFFLNEGFYFGELQVPALMEHYGQLLGEVWVYDDGVVKGFLHMGGTEIKKLYVEPVLHSQGIGEKMLDFAVNELGADHLWALELNSRAIAFYERHGFELTGDRKPEDDTEKMLVLLRKAE